MRQYSEEEIIINYLLSGMSYKEIREKYNFILYTNDPRVERIYDKYKVLNRVQLKEAFQKKQN